jgi:hypothetical protein
MSDFYLQDEHAIANLKVKRSGKTNKEATTKKLHNMKNILYSE